MNLSRTPLPAVLLALVLTPALADEASEARQQIERVVEAINQKSFESIQPMIDRAELSRRVYGVRPSEPNSRQALENSYWEMVEYFLWVGIPESTRQQKVQIAHFRFENGKGFAVLRLRRPGYRYMYTRLDLQSDSRGRMKIVDVHPFNARPSMSVEMADYMATFQPTKATTRSLMKATDLTEAEVFQVSELLKAYRDSDGDRYFRIFDGLDKRLQNEELLLRFNLMLAMYEDNLARMTTYLMPYVEIQDDRDRFSVALAETHILLGDLEQGYKSLLQFKQSYQLDEGAAPARLSALAAALGDLEAAETHALEATQLEPTLELAWWSLLRARVAKEAYEQALEPLTRLEDDFGHRLDEAKLRRDKFHAFRGLVESQAFKDWRAGRE